jgi:hypothetical protein
MNDDFDALGDLYSDPNGPAYRTTENRTGPPLDYVAEKLRRSLEGLHELHRGARAAGRADNEAVRAGQSAFYYGAVAYLALRNMLALADPPEFSDRLLGMSREDFHEWLDGIDREGSVT